MDISTAVALALVLCVAPWVPSSSDIRRSPRTHGSLVEAAEQPDSARTRPADARALREGRARHRLSLDLPEDLRGRHPRTDPLELVDGHAVEAVPAAGLLDRADDHAPDERGDPLHPLRGSIVPRDRRGGVAAVFDRASLRPAWGGPSGRAAPAGRIHRACRACGCTADPRPSGRRSSRRPGRGSPRSGCSSRMPRIARRARYGGGCR